jgi:peptidoglycan/LPS O-acetylase OafA/YrhL
MRIRLTERRDVSQNVGYLAGVDHLRGFAAILMILYHGYQQLGGPQFAEGANPVESFLIEGHTAVALFLVLSGFIFTWGALERGADAVQYGPFLRNRLLRILPMYVVVVVLGMYTNPGGYSLTTIVQLFTLQGTPPIVDGDLGAFGTLLWTISVEFAFYLIFPFLFVFLRRYGPWYLVGLIALANVLRLMSASVNEDGIRDLSYWTIAGRIDQFLVGMLLAWVLVRRRDAGARPGVAWLAVFGGIVIVLGVLTAYNRNGGWLVSTWWKAGWPLVEALAWAVFAGAWIVASRTLSRPVAAALALPGIVSYSAYLLHYVFVAALRDRGVPELVDLGRWNALAVTLVIVVPATFAVATLAYLVVERPFMQRRVRYLSSS